MNISLKRKTATSLARRLTVLTTLLFALGVATTAQAQWQVQDTDNENNTSQIQTNTQNISNQLGGSTSAGSSDTIDGHLKNIDTIGTSYAPASSSSAVASPDQALPAPFTAPTTSGPCGGVASSQQSYCTQILTLQASQYKYLKAMYDMTASRQSDLKALVQARQNLTSQQGQQGESYGLLLDNTNKIEALRAQIEIDHQQMISANLAYNNYIAYLQSQIAQTAKTAASPDSASPVSSVIGSIVSGTLLQTALSATAPNSGQQLGIESSSGY